MQPGQTLADIQPASGAPHCLQCRGLELWVMLISESFYSIKPYSLHRSQQLSFSLPTIGEDTGVHPRCRPLFQRCSQFAPSANRGSAVEADAPLRVLQRSSYAAPRRYEDKGSRCHLPKGVALTGRTILLSRFGKIPLGECSGQIPAGPPPIAARKRPWVKRCRHNQRRIVLRPSLRPRKPSVVRRL